MLDELVADLTDALRSHDAERAFEAVRAVATAAVGEAFGRTISMIEQYLLATWGPVAAAQALRSDTSAHDGESIVRRLRSDTLALAA